MDRCCVYLLTANILLAGPSHSFADPIKFVMEGKISGTLESNALIDEPFIFTGYADTENIGHFSGASYIENDFAILEILGQSLDVITPTRAFVNALTKRVGFTNLDTHNDIFSLQNPVFGSYHLTTSIGPISESNRAIILDNGTPLQTSGGVLLVEGDIYDAGLIFTARLIPEPSSLLLGALAATFCVAIRRRTSLSAFEKHPRS